MMKSLMQSQRSDMMLKEPINHVIPKLAIPTILSMMITAIYNMADTYFVGRISTEASGAVGVIFSAMAMIQAVAFTIGMGCGANMSRALGARNQQKAEDFVALAFFTALFVGILISGTALLCMRPLVRMLGATESIIPHAEAYATYIFIATPLMMTSLAMNNLLRFQGLAFYGMIGMISGGLLNMALDPLFILVFNMGTAGAAIATAISQFVSFCILFYMTNSRDETIHIHIKNFHPTPDMLGRMLYNGMPSLGRQGIAAISTILLNRAAGAINDAAAISAMSIVTRYTMFINSAVIGFGQGFQPVCGFCWGAGKYSRVREAFSFCVKVSTLVLLVLSCLSMLISPQIVRMFRNDPAVVAIGTPALRAQLLTLPLWGLIIMGNMLTQSIGFGLQATVLSIARQGIFLIPALLVLPQLWGLPGIQYAQPICDVMAFLLALMILIRLMKRIKKMNDQPDRDK